MNSVIAMFSRRRAREEACAWLARLDNGLSPELRDEIGTWLEADPRHAGILIEAARFWDRMGMLAELSELFPLEQYSPPRRAVVGRWSVAVTAAAAVVLGLVFLSARQEPVPEATLAGIDPVPRLFQTVVGQQTPLDLDDGSRVVLNTDTQLEVLFSPEERVILLRRGEGFFTVAHDASRPFRVRAGDMVVEAVGTAFNVEIEPSGALSVTVTEGKVNLIPVTAGASTTLTAGQAATVGGDATPRIRELRAEDIDTQLAWQRGMLIFRGETLATVLTEVGRYTTIDFEPEPRIREIRVAGFFRAGDVDGLLVALRENFDIEAQRMPDNRIVLTAR